MADALPPTLLDLTTYVLSLTGKAARAATAEALAADDLRMGDVAVLAALAHEHGLPQRAIANRLRLHPSDVVRLLDHLERGGLVVRTPDPDDRRRHVVSITPAGTRRLGRAVAICAASADDLLGPLDPGERAQLHGLLTKVLASVDDRVPPPATAD